jgi:hypothetical protein
MTELTPQPRYSGLLQLIYPDGTIQYDGQVGLPGDFPLTEAEINDIELQFQENPIEPAEG